MNSRSLAFLAIVFAVAYTVVYLVAVWNNYALFTYHPAIYEIGIGVEKSRDGPAMYWFGWMSTAALGALGVCLIAWLIPERVMQRLWSGWSWVVPIIVLLLFVYLNRNFFIR
ncbi:MAG TPA: hypothetical protein VK642_05525 [Burkholderiales bacterium]|nr:hypothetical protein [Burkholderiales bacterium]